MISEVRLKINKKRNKILLLLLPFQYLKYVKRLIGWQTFFYIKLFVRKKENKNPLKSLEYRRGSKLKLVPKVTINKRFFFVLPSINNVSFADSRNDTYLEIVWFFAYLVILHENTTAESMVN